MDELDPGAKRELLGELCNLKSLLQDNGSDAARLDAGGTPGVDAEPPLLEDFVDPMPAEFDPAAFEDTDWQQFVDQVFAQTSGTTPGQLAPLLPVNAQGGGHSSSTGGRGAGEDALLAELTQQLDARLAALRASMLAEIEAMLERRGRLR